MSLPAYPAYRDSGLPWLGQVPAGWAVVPVKAIASCNDDVLPENMPPDEVIEYVEISDVEEGRGIIHRTPMTFAEAPSRARRKVQAGDVIVSTVRTYLRAIATIPPDCDRLVVSTGFAVFRPRRVLASFLGYLFRTEFVVAQIIARSVGVSYPAINASEVARLPIPLPPPAEQRAIAAFLDRECGKMDALVAEQERLIALLKEKRQAVISHAVTKGLDPNAPMKDSGIPWLGQVPAHWDTTRLKSDLAFLTSGSRGWAQYYADDGPIFLRIGNLTRDSLNLDFSDTERVTVPDGVEGERTRVAPGDVLFSITAFIGSVAVVPEGLGPAFVSQHVALARLHGERLDPRWVGYVVLSDAGKAYLDAQCYGGTKIQLSLDDVANLPLPLPPPTEQRRIVQAIEARLAALGALATEAERAITLLKERRAALISASVTGKIDVRGLAAPAETEATAA